MESSIFLFVFFSFQLTDVNEEVLAIVENF